MDEHKVIELETLRVVITKNAYQRLREYAERHNVSLALAIERAIDRLER